MIIRKAQVGDAHGIAQVHVQSWLETYRGLMPDDVLDNQSVERRETFWKRVIAESLDVHPVFVAANEDKIVAFASGGAARDKFADYDGELYAIYALKKAQGQGIGRKLMQELANALDGLGYKAMMLWVAKGNPTEGFYAHMGGKPFAEKSEMFGDAKLVEIAYGWLDIRTLLVDKEE